MKNYTVLAFLIFSIMLSSCRREDSDSVDQNTIHTRYVLEYNENSDITIARAQFRFGSSTGTILELADDSEILFNGEDMTWKPLLAYYETVMAGYQGTGVFEYSNGDNETFLNQAQVPSSINFPSELNAVNINNSLIIEWEGDALDAGEFCLVTVSGVNTTGDGELFTNYDLGDNEIILPADRLQEIGAGIADMWIQRDDNDTNIDGTEEGGIVVGRYIGSKLNDVDFVQ